MVCGLCAGHMSSATFVLSLQQSERQILLSGRRCWRTWSPSNGWCSRRQSSRTCVRNKRHYLQQELTVVERKLVMDFVEYFLAQWGPGSHASKWYAGAHPFSLTNNQVESDLQRIFGELFFQFFFSNQGMEGNHKEIKANHTFRTELPLGQFIQVLEQLVNTSHHFWSPK